MFILLYSLLLMLGFSVVCLFLIFISGGLKG